jgi:hypothetical protein
MIDLRLKRVLRAALPAVLALALGCSGKSLVFTETAEGTLTLDGAPVPGAHVEFIPDVPQGTRAPGSSAVSDEKGFFKLTRNDNHKPGALVGPHHVVVFPGRAALSKDDTSGPASGTVQLPPVYSNATKTPLLVEVTQERKSYELRLNKNGTAGAAERR